MKYLKFSNLLIIAAGLLTLSAAWADATYIPMTEVAAAVDNTVTSLTTVLVDVSIIAGVGFVLASFFKFHQHRMNPHQVQISQGVSLLIIGCGMILLPLLIPTISTMVLGEKGASTAKVGSAAAEQLIGKPSENY
ncbi:MAG: type IV secretion protein IcmD [Proteobacteria bacterium]|nr:type IV secretion protein IcmD [Pseudomonadota bacterium]